MHLFLQMFYKNTIDESPMVYKSVKEIKENIKDTVEIEKNN